MNYFAVRSAFDVQIAMIVEGIILFHEDKPRKWPKQSAQTVNNCHSSAVTECGSRADKRLGNICISHTAASIAAKACRTCSSDANCAEKISFTIPFLSIT